jgi:hypothetical protein
LVSNTRAELANARFEADIRNFDNPIQNHCLCAAAMKRVFQKLDLRINNQSKVERTDMLLPNGDRIVTTYSKQTRAPIPPSTFEFKPPPARK